MALVVLRAGLSGAGGGLRRRGASLLAAGTTSIKIAIRPQDGRASLAVPQLPRQRRPACGLGPGDGLGTGEGAGVGEVTGTGEVGQDELAIGPEALAQVLWLQHRPGAAQ
jgi:hypothetical protein